MDLPADVLCEIFEYLVNVRAVARVNHVWHAAAMVVANKYKLEISTNTGQCKQTVSDVYEIGRPERGVNYKGQYRNIIFDISWRDGEYGIYFDTRADEIDNVMIINVPLAEHDFRYKFVNGNLYNIAIYSGWHKKHKYIVADVYRHRQRVTICAVSRVMIYDKIVIWLYKRLVAPLTQTSCIFKDSIDRTADHKLVNFIHDNNL